MKYLVLTIMCHPDGAEGPLVAAKLRLGDNDINHLMNVLKQSKIDLAELEKAARQDPASVEPGQQLFVQVQL